MFKTSSFCHWKHFIPNYLSILTKCLGCFDLLTIWIFCLSHLASGSLIFLNLDWCLPRLIGLCFFFINPCILNWAELHNFFSKHPTVPGYNQCITLVYLLSVINDSVFTYTHRQRQCLVTEGFFIVVYLCILVWYPLFFFMWVSQRHFLITYI